MALTYETQIDTLKILRDELADGHLQEEAEYGLAVSDYISALDFFIARPIEACSARRTVTSPPP